MGSGASPPFCLSGVHRATPLPICPVPSGRIAAVNDIGAILLLPAVLGLGSNCASALASAWTPVRPPSLWGSATFPRGGHGPSALRRSGIKVFPSALSAGQHWASFIQILSVSRPSALCLRLSSLPRPVYQPSIKMSSVLVWESWRPGGDEEPGGERSHYSSSVSPLFLFPLGFRPGLPSWTPSPTSGPICPAYRPLPFHQVQGDSLEKLRLSVFDCPDGSVC